MLFKMKNEEYILNEELEIDHKMSFLAQPGTAEGFFYLTRPLLLGEAPPLPRPPLLRRGLQPLHAVPLKTPCGLQGTEAFISPRPISYAT